MTQEPPEDAAYESTEPLSADETAILRELGVAGAMSRRDFVAIVSAIGAAFGVAPRRVLADDPDLPLTTQPATTQAAASQTLPLKLTVNGTAIDLKIDPRTSLLDLLRERLNLTGTKKGCDHGQCGACTVHLDGERVLSCLTLAAQTQNREVTSIEGIADGDMLHPMQTAFIKHDGFQCGYCTPGQICSAVALLKEAQRGDASHATADVSERPNPLSDEEIRERMSGNLCRCGAYPNIVRAIQEVHAGKVSARTWRFVDQAELAALNIKEDADATV